MGTLSCLSDASPIFSLLFALFYFPQTPEEKIFPSADRMPKKSYTWNYESCNVIKVHRPKHGSLRHHIQLMCCDLPLLSASNLALPRQAFLSRRLLLPRYFWQVTIWAATDKRYLRLTCASCSPREDSVWGAELPAWFTYPTGGRRVGDMVWSDAAYHMKHTHTGSLWLVCMECMQYSFQCAILCI